MMEDEKKAYCAVLIVLMISIVLTGCKSDSTPPPATDNGANQVVDGDLLPLKEKTKVIIAEDGAASGAGFYIAEKKGYFKDYNIDVEFATFANSDDMLPALAAGKIDIAGGVSTASFFNSIAQGINVKMMRTKVII